MTSRHFLQMAVIAAVFLAACRKKPPSTAEPAPLTVDFAGCAAVRAGRLCVLDESRKVTLFVPDKEAHVTMAGAPLANDEDVALPDGHRLRVTVPAGAKEITVSTSVGRGAVRFAEPSAPNPHQDAARKLRAESADRALAELALADVEGAPPSDRATAAGLRARIELGRGNVERAIEGFRQAIVWDRRAGHVSDEIDDAFALSYMLHQRGHRYAEARAVLDEVGQRTGEYPEGQAREPYYRAILASELGDRRTSLRAMATSEERAKRLGMVKLSRSIDSARALELLHVGRPREAWNILSAQDKDADAQFKNSPCQRIEHRINMGFAARALEGEPDAPDAVAILETAAGITGCSDRSRRASALGNLAEVAMLRGDAARAKRSLKEARAEADAPRLLELLAWTDVEGHVQLAEKHAAQALASFDRELELARASALPDAEWRALEGRGAALGALGKNAEATQAFRAAEAVLDRQSLAVPLGEGRSDYLRTRAASAENLVDRLVAADRAGEALGAVIHAQARIVLGVARAAAVNRLEGAARDRWDRALHAYREARAALDTESGEDWKYPSGELAPRVARREARERALRGALDDALSALGQSAEPVDPPASDGDTSVAVLAWQKTPGGSVVLVGRGDAVRAVRLAGVDARLLSASLPPLLAGAKRLRIEPGPLTESVDIAALDFVADTFVVEHVIPLPRHPERSEGSPNALVVADPLNDLAESRREADGAIKSLTSRGFHVRSLFGEDARGDTLRSALTGSGFFHYAGHGQYAGRDGWESSLPLSSGSHLSIGEILALASPPARVILSGCETAGAKNQGLGLASAFVIAGSLEVVGPTRPVSDKLAGAISRGIYAALDQDKTRDLATALAESVRQVKRVDPAGDWPAFRALRR
jgi:tetratricopeptide (TPR) repeat protein